MNKAESDAFLFFTHNYHSAVALVFMRLYHWGTISWAGHAAGDWFFKSINDLSTELGISTKPVRKAYDLICAGKCSFFESRLGKRKNHSITYFRVTNKIGYHVPQVHGEASSACTSGTQYHAPEVHGINISTHINNSMYTAEPVKPLEQQMVEVSKRQTDDSSKMVEIWNELIRPRRPETMSTRREQQCSEVLRDHFNNDLDQWREHCVRISQSSWLTGDDFTLYLGWALKPEHIQEIRNGKYVDNANKLKKKALAESSKQSLTQLPTIALDEALSDCTSEVDRKVKEALFKKMDANSYASWIARTGENAVVFEIKNGYICVKSSNKFIEDKIKTKFWDEVESCFKSLLDDL